MKPNRRARANFLLMARATSLLRRTTVARGRLPAAVAVTAALLAGAASGQETSCTICHADADLFDAETAAIVADHRQDVHAEVGLSCHDCHGGNPDPALADDIGAMDEEYAEHPYVGVPEPAQVPEFCGRCHSDPRYMKRFKPDARVDQVQEYWTSQHGIALAAGNERVATCVDCHGVHGIRRSTSPESSVYPTQVAETCRSCHADAELMAGATLPDGRSLPLDQYARWRQSTHAAALIDREDLSAPTCNDCHGNHGAAPPGLDSVTFVCGQCHGREAEIFRTSPKHEGFLAHNDYLADAGEERCAACHEAPQARVTSIDSFTECTTCHGNHGIVRPTVAMFGALPGQPCAFCHEGPAGVELPVLEPEKSRRHFEEVRDKLLAEAEKAGLTGVEQFDWLVDQALGVEAHSLAGEVEGGSQQLRPEFEMLFRKFRIGKTYYNYDDPVTGRPVRASLVRCNVCHLSEGVEPDGPHGAVSGIEMVNRMRELTARTARAERILLAARRGGVETREALLAIDHAIDAQIGLEVLTHTFSTDPDGEFVKRAEEGLAQADLALAQGQEALEELDLRRRWLALSLLAIVAVLIGLAIKIRQLSTAAAAEQPPA